MKIRRHLDILYIIIIINIIKVSLESDIYGENVAFHKPAESSTLFKQPFVIPSADNVVDGSNSSERHTCMVTALGDSNPWIQVDLLTSFTISSVSLRNALPSCGGCSSKLHDVHIEVYREKPAASDLGNGDECYFYKGALPLGKEENLKCYHPVTGRYVKVYSKGRRKFDTFALCELRVYVERIHTKNGKTNTNRRTRRSACECAVLCGQHKECTGFRVDGPSCSSVLDSQQAPETKETLSTVHFQYKKTDSTPGSVSTAN